MTRHLRVFAIAAAFGLAAYVVMLGVVAVSRRAGVLAWLTG